MTGQRPPQTFPSTCWTRIQDGALQTSGGRTDWEHLAQSYWRPVHRYLRATGYSEDQATECTQSFFAWAFESDLLSKAAPQRGRFRAFVKTALRHYLSDQYRRGAAQKRGGDRGHVPLEADDASPSRALESPTRSPDEALDSAWRKELVRITLQRLQQELEDSRRPQWFSLFQSYYLDAEEDVSYEKLAARHDVSRVDVSNALQRTKQRYRSILKNLLMETVQNHDELEEEMLWFFGKNA